MSANTVLKSRLFAVNGAIALWYFRTLAMTRAGRSQSLGDCEGRLYALQHPDNRKPLEQPPTFGYFPSGLFSDLVRFSFFNSLFVERIYQNLRQSQDKLIEVLLFVSCWNTDIVEMILIAIF